MFGLEGKYGGSAPPADLSSSAGWLLSWGGLYLEPKSGFLL